MKNMYLVLLINLLFSFLTAQNLNAQQIVDNIVDLNSLKSESEINEFEQPRILYSSPDALFKQTLVPDFRVNEQIGNSQKNYVGTAINENGTSLTVWNDYREGTQNIYAQLVKANGEKIGENIKLNSPNDGKLYSYPEVIVNNDNQFLVIWFDGRADYAIYGQLIDENGSLIGENYKISDDNSTSYKYSTCIGSNGNEIIVAWLDGRKGSNYDIYAQRLNKDGSKIGDNFIVNADTQGVRKSVPQIAIDNDGNIISTWYSYENGSNNIYAVVRDSGNNIITSQAQINDTGSASSNNYVPVVSSGNIGFLIAWAKYMDNDYNVWGQFLDKLGNKIDTNFIINDNVTSLQHGPSISSNSLGNIFVSWYDYRNGYPQIYGQEFFDDTMIGNNFKISEDEMTGGKSYVSCSINSHRKMTVSWMDLIEPTQYGIYSRALDSLKIPITTSIRIDNDSLSSKQQNPTVEVFEDGSYVIVWADFRYRTTRAYFQIYDKNNNPIGENIYVSSKRSQYYPGIIKLGHNNFLIYWREYVRDIFNQYEIVAQKYSLTGEKMGDKFKVSQTNIKGSVSNIAGASNLKGEFVFAWDRRVGNVSRIYSKKYDADGVEISSNILVSKDTTINSYHPKVGLDSAGNFAITYYSRLSSYNEIFLTRYNSDGTEIDSTIIVTDDKKFASKYNPDISVNAKGDCIVTWFDYRSQSGVYFQKYEQIGTSDLFKQIDSNTSVTDYNFSYCLPSVSMNDQEEFVISWSESNNTFSDLKFRLFESNQTAKSEILYGSESQERNQSNPDIYLSADKIYNVWQDNHEPGVGYDIWANVFNYQDLLTDLEVNGNEISVNYKLNQNYPNPFNPSTVISFSIPQTANVELNVYNILGQKVAVLLNDIKQPGNYKISWDASDMSSGVYVYKLQAGKRTFIRKMLLLK